MAPFLNHLTVFQQDEARIRADDGLQRDVVRLTEGVFGSRHVLPAGDGFGRTGSETVEGIALLHAVVVDTVQFVELRVVGLFQMGGY